MTQIPDNLRFDDMELLRIVMRACDHRIALTARVILACKGSQPKTGDVSDALNRIRDTLSGMEGKALGFDEVVRRIAEAEPVNPMDI